MSRSSDALGINLFLFLCRVPLIFVMVPLREAEERVPDAKQSLFMCSNVDMGLFQSVDSRWVQNRELSSYASDPLVRMNTFSRHKQLQLGPFKTPPLFDRFNSIW